MILRFAIFITIMTVLVVSGHVYLYRRLVRDTTHDRRLRLAGMVVISLLGAMLVGGRFLQRFLPELFGDLFSALSFIWMGVALFLVLTLLAINGTRRVGEWIQRLRQREPALVIPRPNAAPAEGALSTSTGPSMPEPDVSLERRLFLSRTVAGSAALVTSSLAGYGTWRAYHAPEVTELAVKLRGLPKALDGLSIVQLTDIHVGNMIERKFMDDLVRRANALEPDLVAITGDLVDGDVPTLGRAVAALGDLRSKFGSYFITGNHEYYSSDEAWCAFLETIGVQVLRNRRVSIGDAGGSFDLVGVDDWSERDRNGYDLDRALAGRDPDRAAVLLAHQPANFPQAVEKGIGLQLSGHTHGGQLFPFTAFVSMAWAYSAGLYREKDAHIYVSRGCGFWGPPMRVGSPPELVKLVLTA